MRTGALAFLCSAGAVLSCGPQRQTLEQVAAAAQAVELRLAEDDQGRPEGVEAVGFDQELLGRLQRLTPTREAWRSVFSVEPTEGLDAGSALPGEYVVTDTGVLFLPRTPLQRGKTYRATWTSAGTEVASADLSPHRAGREIVTRAIAIYPTSDVLPINLRRLHVEFNAPMPPGGAAQSLRLVRDPDGAPVELALPAPEEEMWNEQKTLFTLELAPRPAAGEQDGGELFRMGQRYRLVVLPTWRDGDGAPISGLDKLFLVDAADRTASDPSSWKIEAPFSRQAPLVIELPEPLDYAMLQRAIEVRRREGAALEGRVRVSDSETRVTFQSESGWSSGTYVLRIAQDLEDPAGNAVGGGSQAGQGGQRAAAVLPFEVELRPVPTARGPG